MIYAVATSLTLAFSLSTPPTTGHLASVRSAVHAVEMSLALQEEAKQVWLAKLEDVRTVGPTKLFGGDAVGSVVPTAASTTTSTKTAEEAAKQAWLAKLDEDTWGKAAATTTKMAANEEAAKQAWLASLDTPIWGAIAAATSEVAAVVAATPSDESAAQETAKQAWLAKLDAPTWGKAAAALVEAAGAANVAADEAKRAWLEKLEKVQTDGPVKTFGGASMAAIVAELRKEDNEESREMLKDAIAAEEAAKKAWLASLDTPTWGAISKAVTAIADEVAAQPSMTAEEIAKREWIAKVEAAHA